MKTLKFFCLAQLFLKREMFQIKLAQKTKSMFIFNNFFSENLSVYEIMWKNMVEPGRCDNINRRMHVECWVTWATHS